MTTLPNALEALSAVNQFVLWKAVPSVKRAGKIDKFPMSADGKIIDAHDSQHWLSGADAVRLAGETGCGYGFVFTSNDPFFCIDIDGAYDGQWSALSSQLCGMFPSAAVEVSHSGRGLHVIGRYDGEEPDHACKNIPLGVELYTSGRFIALTGNGARGDAGAVQDLSPLITQYFPASSDTDRPSMSWTTTNVEGSHPLEDDTKLIEKALKSTSMFGQSASFADLWNCNVDALAERWPDDDGKRPYDASSVDAALAQHLCWWTGNNCERVERLMRLSSLVRDKWDYHRSYMERTICGAASRTLTFYDKGKPIEVVEDVANPVVTLKDGMQLLAASQQVDLFDGCVYVCSTHQIFTPRGSMLKPDRFNAMYGGYQFAQDHENEKSTRKAWEAFTESMVANFPKVDGTCFKPQLPSGQITKKEGQSLVNIYKAIETPTSDGDVTPFLTHLNKLIPNQRDQTILLSYMAACIQHKGYKIQWAPFIQGTEGNGKTLFTRCMVEAIGERYSHMPPAEQLGEKFNSWMFGKLFIGVEDIYVPNEKREVLEIMKPMITSKRLAKRAMGVDQEMDDVCANFIFNSNYKDAMKVTVDTRRYCTIYTAQQSGADNVRDGLTGDYFERLYKWLDDGGYAAVAGYLTRYSIPAEFDVTGSCQRAPKTSSTDEAVNLSMGTVEQEIMDAIEEGLPGFRGGWVSSIALDGLIEKMRKSSQIPKNKRLEMMRSLGYDYHPNLKGGRVNSPTMVDNGRKPRLYIRVGHINCNIVQPVEVARQYESDNGNVLAGIGGGHNVSEGSV